MKALLNLVAVCGLVTGLLLPVQGATADSAAEESVAALHRLFDRAWQRRLEENPRLATNLGDLRYNDRWEDRSLKAIESSHTATVDELKALHAIDRDLLPPAERINYGLFELQLGNSIEAHRFREFLMPVSHMGGIQTLHTLTETLPLRTTAHYEDWLARLDQLDTLIDQYIALMNAGMEEGRMPPRTLMERVPAQLAGQIVDAPAESPFFAAFKRIPETIPETDRERLSSQALEVIDRTVLPAYRRLASFFNEKYLPATRETYGVWDLPDGGEYYAHRARRFTTTTLTPDEIHQIGLDEVARIRGEMKAVIEQVEFDGSFDEFLVYLRTDPRFYYQTSEELFQAYQAMSKRIDPLIVQLFGRLPRIPYGVRPIPEAVAPDVTTAYYSRPAADGTRAGYYYVNLYRPEVRPKYEMMALSLHEAVPGHHLQIALAMELDGLPMFRRMSGFTAFSEGWGLYAERLGEELGLYEDPYDKFGQLTYEMWRAVRLVVDTGLHHKRWSRRQAIDFFAENAAKTETDIINEIDRYIGNPGQALAYKIGELKIRELRARAEETLGENFDIRAFHDAVLENGAVPLELLERLINEWIAAQGNEQSGAGP